MKIQRHESHEDDRRFFVVHNARERNGAQC
jgi:hypothetical protein